MLAIAQLIPLALGAFILYRTGTFINNIRLAKATGLPFTYSPYLEFETIAYFGSPFLRWLYMDYLLQGHGYPPWARFMIKDWPWEDKRRAHDKWGDCFLVVAPTGIICYAADPAMSMDVTKRRMDFTKPPDKYAMIQPYGTNIVTAEGKQWQFHVRITAPPFNEANNHLNWSETLRQAQSLSDSWGRWGSRDLHLDIYSLTLNIISCAGFGIRQDWSNDTIINHDKVPKGHTFSFLQAITTVVKYIVPILLLPTKVMLYTPLRKGAKAYIEFEQYMRDVINGEKAKIEANAEYENTETKGNLLTAMLKVSASEAKNANKNDGGTRKTTFSDDEVLGNAFMFFLAGYDTTANSMIYGCICLALYEGLQDSVVEEIDRVYEESEKAGRTELSYDEDYPKLKYTLCFMYEILRAFPVVIHLTKMCWKPQPIVWRTGKEKDNAPHVLPAKCRMYLNTTGTHYNTKYWSDPYKLDPNRWMNDSHGPTSAARKVGPVKGSFIGFSEGARACLGWKFAEVEFLAFFAVMLRQYRVRLAGDVPKSEIEKQIFRRCAGDITLSPFDNVKLMLDKRR
ncbi:MAG: hypothetical protein Q9220_006541 [cf. Caloplaca sp. 1 TL-2023]